MPKGKNPCELVHQGIGGSSIQTDVTSATEFCIGEKVTSFRQLMKRMTKVVDHDTSSGVTGI